MDKAEHVRRARRPARVFRPLGAQSAPLAHGRIHTKAHAQLRGETGGATARVHKVAIRLSPAEPHSNAKHPLAKNAKARLYGRRYVGISCVPYARSVSGIDLKGNAFEWWYAAAGIYERGSRPEAGSVLNFRASGRMRLGHVAVVTRVLNSREVEIDHANWWGPGAGKGGISYGTPVVDVSENNDWSEVRVGLGRSGDLRQRLRHLRLHLRPPRPGHHGRQQYAARADGPRRHRPRGR